MADSDDYSGWMNALGSVAGWPHRARGAWQLYGHSHGNLPDDPLALSMDVGVDSHDFRPWHFDEIQAVMKIKVDAKAKHVEKTKSALMNSSLAQ